MNPTSFFEFSAYHVALAVVGGIIILARWLPRFVTNQEPASAPLLVVFGAGAALIVPGLPPVPEPRSTPHLWEIVSEICVIVALFGAGMRIDDLRPWSKWNSTWCLLVVAMPLTITVTALLGVWLGGLAVASAVLLGAVLSPNDPVLAADVQVGPPREGDEHPVRFTLTTEAALNDGLAFPFVYFAIALATHGALAGEWLWAWLGEDVLYRIIVGTAVGGIGGWLLGHILFSFPKNSVVADTGSGVVAIAGVFLCYGSTELVEGYGFIAVAVMGLILRRIEKDHEFHTRLHDFSESIEHALTAILLIALGAALPILLPILWWQDILMVALLLALIRPLTGWIELKFANLPNRDRAVISVYGVRGIGSIYYLSYALPKSEFADADRLWAIVAFTILLSTMLHGFSVGWAMNQVSETTKE